MIENNPYEGYFNKEQEKRLANFIDIGVTGDALAMGLANKFELEACNEYLLVDVGIVPMQVSRNLTVQMLFIVMKYTRMEFGYSKN